MIFFSRMFAQNRSARERLIWSLLVIACIALTIAGHWPEFDGYFLIDDFLWLHLANWRSMLDSFIGTQGAHLAYRPVFRLSVYLDALLHGRNAAGWHLTNMLLHAANALLLAAILRAFNVRVAVAAAAAVLFALAPLSGEAVNWISGRTAALSTTFVLLALLLWIVSLKQQRAPWAAATAMAFGLATYEAAIVTPALCACLAPIVVKYPGITWRHVLRSIAIMLAALVAFWIVRTAALGTLVGRTAVPSLDLWANTRHHLDDLLTFTRVLGGDVLLALLALALVVTTLVPRLFPVGPCLLMMVIVFLVPFSQDPGTGGRFFYTLQAPACALLALCTLALPRRAVLPALGLLLAVLLPTFFTSSYREAASHAASERKARTIIAAVRSAIPSNDGYPHVVSDVPLMSDHHLLIGYFFEIAVADSYQTASPPQILNSATVLSSPALRADILRQPTRFWRYDAATDRLLSMGRPEWLSAHPDEQ